MSSAKLALIYTLSASAGATVIILVLEELGSTFPFWAYLISPIIIFTVVCRRSLKRAALCSVIAALLMSGFYYCPWPSRRHFLHDLKRIQTGMSMQEVKAIMKSYHEGTGWPAISGTSSNSGTLNDLGSGNEFQTTTNAAGELALQNCIVYRHDLGEADWGIVEFKSNRVTAVSFSPD